MKSFKNRRIRLILAGLLVLVMLFQFPAIAEPVEEEVTEDSVYLEDDMLSAGETEGEQTEMVDQDCQVGDPEENTAQSVSEPDPEHDEEETLGDNFEDVEPEGSVSTDAPVESSEDEEVQAAASPSLALSASSVTIKKGNTVSVTVTAKNFSGRIYLTYSTNNTSAYSCSWGSWNKTSIPIRITGKALGNGRVTIKMVSSSNGRVLATTSFAVYVTSPEVPKLTLSSSSVNIAAGKSARVTVNASGYSGRYYLQYSNSNSAVNSCSWGSWSGSSIPLTITGKAAGSSRVTIYMKSSTTNAVLATAYISVSVYQPNNPKLELSVSSLNLKQGASASITARASGYNGTFYLSYSSTNTAAYTCSWGKWSGNSIPLTVSAKNAGSGKVTIYMKTSGGTVLTSKSITVTVPQSTPNPTLVLTKTSVSLSAGASTMVQVTVKNPVGRVQLQYSNGNSSAMSLSWGSWSGYTIPLTIRGTNAGSGYITIYLKNASTGAVYEKKTIYVSVTKKSKSIQDVGYGFRNYSKKDISYTLCKMMFGNTQKARNVYYADIGNGGVCFGMATSSALLDVNSSAPYVSTFNSGKSVISSLSKSDRSSSLGLYVTDFVEAMHLTQVSAQMSINYNLNTLVSTVKSQTDSGIPVVICMTGKYSGSNAGHAVLAFGYNQVSSTRCDIRICDSNYTNSSSNMVEKTLTVTRSSSSGAYNSWSYSPLSWGYGKPNASIGFVTYNTCLNVWNRRGNLNSAGMNLLSTKEDDFKLINFDGDVVAQYVDGELVKKADDVIEPFLDNIGPDGIIADKPNLLYVPVDYYTVQDDSSDTPMEMSLADDMLSVQVKTEADEFELCAQDSSNVANALLNIEEGQPFSISLGSSRPGEPDEVKVEGLGMGEPISIGMENGKLSIMGADAANLSIMNYDLDYAIEASAQQGGEIEPSGRKDMLEGGNALYTITPKEGYRIRSVYVDGEDVGPVREYCFENVGANHTISATFAKDISTCEVQLSQNLFSYDGSEHYPGVTVTDPEGKVLEERVDYELGYANNVEVGKATVYVLAKSDGGYYGTQTAEFEINAAQNAFVSANIEGSTVSVQFTHSEPVNVVVSAYASDGRMIAAKLLKAAMDVNALDFFFGVDLGGASEIKAMMLDSAFKPRCASYRVR